jgi:hypothetical protein
LGGFRSGFSQTPLSKGLGARRGGLAIRIATVRGPIPIVIELILAGSFSTGFTKFAFWTTCMFAFFFIDESTVVACDVFLTGE